MAGLAALGIAGGGALAEPSPNISLPAPATPKISVPASAQLMLLPDEISSVDLSKTVHVSVGREGIFSALQVAPRFTPTDNEPPPTLTLASTRTTSAMLDWDVSDWGSLGLTTQNSAGSPTLLGDFTPSPLSFSDQTKTTGAGIAAKVKFGDGWITTFAYNIDTTQLDLKAGASPAIATTSTRGQSYGLSIAKHGVFGNADALGLSISRPSEDYFGSISLADSGLENRVNLVGRYPGFALNSETKETDIALGYVTTFFDGALALQANAGYQMNVGGQNGVNSVSVLSRAKINF